MINPSMSPPLPDPRLPETPETHRTQVEEPWSEDPAVKEALENANAELQSLSDKDGPTHYDEYSFVIDEMPLGVTPQEFLNQMMRNLNGTVNNPEFDGYSDFKPRVTSKDPQLGDIVDNIFEELLNTSQKVEEVMGIVSNVVDTASSSVIDANAALVDGSNQTKIGTETATDLLSKAKESLDKV